MLTTQVTIQKVTEHEHVARAANKSSIVTTTIKLNYPPPLRPMIDVYLFWPPYTVPLGIYSFQGSYLPLREYVKWLTQKILISCYLR